MRYVALAFLLSVWLVAVWAATPQHVDSGLFEHFVSASAYDVPLLPSRFYAIFYYPWDATADDFITRVSQLSLPSPLRYVVRMEGDLMTIRSFHIFFSPCLVHFDQHGKIHNMVLLGMQSSIRMANQLQLESGRDHISLQSTCNNRTRSLPAVQSHHSRHELSMDIYGSGGISIRLPCDHLHPDALPLRIDTRTIWTAFATAKARNRTLVVARSSSVFMQFLQRYSFSMFQPGVMWAFFDSAHLDGMKSVHFDAIAFPRASLGQSCSWSFRMAARFPLNAFLSHPASHCSHGAIPSPVVQRLFAVSSLAPLDRFSLVYSRRCLLCAPFLMHFSHALPNVQQRCRAQFLIVDIEDEDAASVSAHVPRIPALLFQRWTQPGQTIAYDTLPDAHQIEKWILNHCAKKAA
jgi:hypothetical protein